MWWLQGANTCVSAQLSTTCLPGAHLDLSHPPTITTITATRVLWPSAIHTHPTCLPPTRSPLPYRTHTLPYPARPAVQVVSSYSAEFNADEVFANERSAVIAHLPSMDDAPRGAGAGGAGGVGFFETATAGAAKTDLAAMEMDADEEEEEGSEEGDDGEEGGGGGAGLGFGRLHSGAPVKMTSRMGCIA